MFDEDPFWRKCVIKLLILLAELFSALPFSWSNAVCMNFSYSLITSIALCGDVVGYKYLWFFKHFEIMLFALCKWGKEYLESLCIDYDLGFDGVPLFLPWVVFPLLFLGLWMGDSAASTVITFMSCWSSNSFLLGNRNSFALTSTFSIHIQLR